MRTDWEKRHILYYRDIRFAKQFFNVKNIRHWHLLTITCVFLPQLAPLLDAANKILLKLPCIKLLSWMFTFELAKPMADM